MKAAIYARYSSDNQREESIDAQIRAIKDFAIKQGFEIVKIYTDEAKSATSDDRPQFLQMIKDSSLGIFDTVIVHKLDRFARNRYDSAFYKRQLKKNGVRLVSVLENLDDSPESIILESVLEGMAEYYSRNLAREVMKGMKENAIKAKHNGGTPPLGYDVVDGKYVINEKEAQIVRYIFQRYAEEIGYKKLIQELKARGFKTKRGNDFTQASLHDILKNEKYTGCYVFNRQAKKDVNGKRNQHKSKPDDEIIKVPGAIPQIIPVELFNKIKKRMQSRANGKNKAKQIYLLSGKIFCAKCGAALIGHTTHMKGKIYPNYICGTKYRTKNCDLKAVKRDYVEEKVIENLKISIFNPDAIKSLTSKLIGYYNKMIHEDAEDLELLEEKLKEIQKKIDNIVSAIADGMYSPTMKVAMNKLEEEKNQVISTIHELRHKLETHSLNEELIEKYLIKDMHRLQNKNVDDIQEIINTYVDKVIVYDDKVITNLRVLHM
ncbi:recombinase family protein, partial [Caloramator mitchellensis]|uniref:recombinase family protein n=1 Tax=Caloramator mitchellensis TaxID=908809 RepID=UPI000716FA21